MKMSLLDDARFQQRFTPRCAYVSEARGTEGCTAVPPRDCYSAPRICALEQGEEHATGTGLAVVVMT